MRVAMGGRALAADEPLRLGIGKQAILAGVCACAGIAPLAARWIHQDIASVGYGLVLTVAYLAFALVARRSAHLSKFAEISFAFFVFALVQVLNNAIPGAVGTYLLHVEPNAGNPFASTVSGTVTLQLLGALIAIVPIVALTKLSGADLASIYVRKNVDARWLLFAIATFAVCFGLTATSPLRPGSFMQRLLPTNGAITVERLIALSPALLIMVLSNGFEEEFLFRALFLRKYTWMLGPLIANVVQAVIFSIAHVGVGYTPMAVFFVVGVVFPLGLLAGYLMRASDSVVVPAIVHAGLDLPIYLVFLSYTS